MEKYEKFFEKGWINQLQEFFKTDEFDKIGKYLRYKKQQGLVVHPKHKDIFNAFKECPWHKLNSVIMGISPYISLNSLNEPISDGLAFSASYADVRIPTTLELLKKEINEEILNEYESYDQNTSLKYLANQGILLLNCALTITSVKNPYEHLEIWRPFIEKVLTIINNNKDGIGFLLMGEPAKKFIKLLTNPSFAVYTCDYPLESLNNNQKWSSNNGLKALDAFLSVFNNINIKW